MAGFFDILAGAASAGLNYVTTKQLNKENAELNQQYWDIQAQRQFQLNEKAADNAMKRSIDMYNLLQSPSAMVKQLREAGLNPALMYSQGGMGGSVQQGPQGGATGGTGTPTLGLQQIIDPLTMAQIENINADTKNKEADTEKKKEETISEKLNQNLIETETEFKEIQKMLEQNNLTISNETINDKITSIKTDAQKAVEELEKLKLENGITKETYNDQIQKIKQDTINTITQGEIMLLEKDKLNATINNLNMDTKKKEQEIQEIKWKCNLLRQEVAKALNEVNLTYYMTLTEKNKAIYYQNESTRIATELANKYGWTFTKQDVYNIVETILSGTGMIFGISSGSAVVGAMKPAMGKIGF